MTSRLAKAFAILVLVLAGTQASVCEDDNVRMRISHEVILGALHSSGMQISPGQMEQLSGVTATEPNPLLRVVSVDLLDGESDKVLLRCQHPNTCLPFYVLVHWGQPGDRSGVRPDGTGEMRSQSGQPAEKLLVRSGKIAVLLLEGEYIHITLPVLCLQNGGRGQQVRVISKDTKKRYLARVVGPGVVTSGLSE